MDIDVTVHYPAPLEEVWAMVTDPDFTRKERLAEIPAQLRDQAEVELDQSETVSTLTVVSPIPTDRLPGPAARFLPTGLRATVTDTLGPADAEGTREGTITLELPGVPVQARATQRLVGRGQSTERQVTGTLSVNIPLIGGSVEKALVQRVDEVVRAEEAAARRWLAS